MISANESNNSVNKSGQMFNLDKSSTITIDSNNNLSQSTVDVVNQMVTDVSKIVQLSKNDLSTSNLNSLNVSSQLKSQNNSRNFKNSELNLRNSKKNKSQNQSNNELSPLKKLESDIIRRHKFDFKNVGSNKIDQISKHIVNCPYGGDIFAITDGLEKQGLKENAKNKLHDYHSLPEIPSKNLAIIVKNQSDKSNNLINLKQRSPSINGTIQFDSPQSSKKIIMNNNSFIENDSNSSNSSSSTNLDDLTISSLDKTKEQIDRIIDKEITDNQTKCRLTSEIMSLMKDTVQEIVNQELNLVKSRINNIKKNVRSSPYSKSKINTKISKQTTDNNLFNHSVKQIVHQSTHNEFDMAKSSEIVSVKSQKENSPRIIKHEGLHDKHGNRYIGVSFNLKTFDKNGQLKCIESYNREEDPLYIKIKQNNEKKKQQSVKQIKDQIMN